MNPSELRTCSKDVLKILELGNQRTPSVGNNVSPGISVVIFGSSDAEIWGPWRTAGEAVIAARGIDEIEVAQVLGALQRLGVPA